MPAWAQTAAFTTIDPPSPDVSPTPQFRAPYLIEFNHSGMRQNPATVAVHLPAFTGPGKTFTFTRSSFSAERGFASDGTPRDVDESSYRYAWRGTNENSALRLFVDRGSIAGILATPEARYVINARSAREIIPDGFPADDSLANNAPGPVLPGKTGAADTTKSIASAGPNDLGLLILYTGALGSQRLPRPFWCKPSQPVEALQRETATSSPWRGLRLRPSKRRSWPRRSRLGSAT